MKKDLSEPLISDETKQRITDYNITLGYKEEQEQKRKLPEQKKYEDIQQAPVELQKIQQAKIMDQEELNSNTNMLQGFDEYDSDMSFYKKSTAVHEVPAVSVEKSTFYIQKPTIFACILKSGTEKFKYIDVKEMIGLDDYKKLCKLRVRNYIAIIKMLYRIYHNHKKQDEMFKEFRTKLIQIQKLLSHLYMDGEYTNLYSKIKENIYPFSKDNKKEEEKKAAQIQLIDLGKGDLGTDEFVDQDEEDGNNNNHDSDEEYDSFFKKSSIAYYSRSDNRILIREEEKWELRAKWLEYVLDLLRCDENLINWFPWFQAKMDQLVDLDVNIPTGSNDSSSEVFYVQKFIEDKMKQFDSKTEYETDDQIYIDKQNFYPNIEQNTKDLQNDFRSFIKAWTDVREKLCLKIKKRESDTDYFLTVFEKKPLGNEKIYEKRISTRGSPISIQKFEFSQNGKYIQFGFNLNSLNFEIIFPLTISYKEPLIVKSDCIFSGFSDHSFTCIKGQNVYTYDLQDYSKRSKMTIPYSIDYIQNFTFSPSGFSYIRQIKQEENEALAELQKKSPQSHELFIKDKLCIIEQTEKFPDDAQFMMNGMMDKFLVQYWAGNNLVIARYGLENKSGHFSALLAKKGQPTTQSNQPTFKKEHVFTFITKDLFELEKDKLSIKLVSLIKDFLIIFKTNKAGKNKCYIFQNDQFKTTCNTENFDLISVARGPEGFRKIFILEDASQFEGYMRYRIFAWNQDMVNVMRSWIPDFEELTSATKEIEIRINNKHNALAIEKYVDKRCVARLMMTAYGMPFGEDRNVTRPNESLSSRQTHYWLFIMQTKSEISAYTRDIRYNFHLERFQELESIFTYTIDEQSEEIFDILVDTLALNRVDLYLVFSNGQIKRFTCPIAQYKPVDGFIDDPLLYSIDMYMATQKKDQASQQDSKASGGASSKKVDLWENRIDCFIANKMLYSNQLIVDFNPTKPQDRIQYGYKLPMFYNGTDYIRRVTLSTNEGKLVGVYKYDASAYIIVSPLLNARQIPLFAQNQFVHPVVPMVDKLKGYTQVFTLTLQNMYSEYNDLTHSKFKQKGYRLFKMLSPGFLIKYFNGIEQKVPFSYFGEEYEDIIRFKQSLNGKFLVIFGTRKGKEFETETYLKDNNIEIKKKYQGIFVYEVGLGSIKLIKSFLFAEKNVMTYRTEVNQQQETVGNELNNLIQEKETSEIDFQSKITGLQTKLEIKKKKLEEKKQNQLNAQAQNPSIQNASVKSVVSSGSAEDMQFQENQKIQEENKAKVENEQQSIEKLEKDITDLEAEITKEQELNTEKVNTLDAKINTKKEEQTRLQNVLKKLQNRHYQPATFPEYAEPEVKGTQNNEYDTNYTEYGSFYYSLEGYYNDTVDFSAYNEEYVLNEQIEKIKKEPMPLTTVKGIERQYEQEAELKEEYIKMPRVKNLKTNYKDLDIAYIEDKPYEITSYLEPVEKSLYFIRDLPNTKLRQGEQVQEVLEDNYMFDEVEREQIKRIQYNIHLEVGEQGDIFLIERVHNRLYYFYKSDADYKLVKRTFEKDFLVSSADSSDEYMVISSSNRYQVFNIDRKAELTPFKVNPLLKDKEKDKDKQVVFLDSKVTKKEGDIKKLTQAAYEWTLENCKIKGDHLILRINDNQNVQYLRVFDVKSKINVLYIEGSKIAVSGCKQYLWLIDSNQVYDVQNGLSTYFLWPGDQINTIGYDSYDLFNVIEDRTIMPTLGYLQLAFNYISLTIDQEQYRSVDFKTNTVSKTKCFQYMFYKIGNKKSILERIFKDDNDKLYTGEEPVVPDPEEAKKEKTVEEKKQIEENESQKVNSQMKQLFGMLSFLTEQYSIEQNNPAFITDFFFSYYFIEKGVNGQVKYHNLFSKMYFQAAPRTDIIDDILHYVVLSNVPILQYVINTCFLKFLNTANSSTAFQEYLRNITKQTSAMTQLDKFQMIKDTEESTIYVDSYDSPILDDGFYEAFREDTAPKKDVDVYYIQLGEILFKQGEELMEILTDEKYLPMMDIPFIQYLVMYQWSKVKKNIQMRLLIPFFILLFIFFLYATFQIDWYKDEKMESLAILTEIQEQITSGLTDGSYNGTLTIDEINQQILVINDSLTVSFLWVANVFGLFSILGYLLFMEGKQLRLEPKEYFTELWNVVDLMNYFLCLFVLLFDIFQASITTIRPLAAVCVILLWIKLFYFLRVFETTSKLVRMIFEIVNDMKNFLIVLSIGVIGFANGFYILAQAQKDGLDPFAGTSFIQALIWTYRLSLGDFQIDDFYSLYTIDVIIVWIIFIIASLFVLIVLMNLLIAIMGDTFSRVLENITNLQVREKVMLVAENESLFERKTIFGNSQYLIVIKEKSLEASQSEGWDGQINALKRTILDKLSSLETSLDTKINDSGVEMKRRFADFDEKSKKMQSQIESKISSSNKTEIDAVYEKISGMFDQLTNKITTQMGSIQVLQDQMKQVGVTNQKLSSIQRENFLFKKSVYEKLEIDTGDNEESEEEEY